MTKNLLLIGLMALGVQAARAYSLIGPAAFGDDAWQVPIIGYNPLNNSPQPPFILDNLVTGPKNIGEGYRRNTPVMYYAADANFLNYFGSNGLAQLDQAYVVLNNDFATNVDSYSPNLVEFPLNSQGVNYQAQALGLLDLKSVTLELMAEQLGLADSVRYTWTLHNRFIATPPGCPNGGEYTVVMRNYDITAAPVYYSPPGWGQYSPYVNGELFTYSILETCSALTPTADAYEVPTDPLALNPPVSSTVDGLFYTGFLGGFFYDMTRDDMAGLRYLLSTNNLVYENAAAGTLLLSTNLGALGPFVTTSNLSQLLVFAQTNAPGLIPGSFPNVVVASSVTNWVVVTNWQITSSFISPLGAPAGTSLLVVSSNIIGTSFQPVYADTFANVITNGNLTNFQAFLNVNGTPQSIVLTGTNVVLNYSPNTAATIQTVTLERPNGAQYGTISTNIITQNVIFSNQPSGEYIVLPPSQCGWRISNQNPAFSIVTVSNLITTVTNTTITNAIGFVGSVSVVYNFTNHTYLAEPINCASATPAPGVYQGVGRCQFVRANFDSLLGRFFQPITNNYTMTLVTNGQIIAQNIQRVITQPDFLFTATDFAPGPSTGPAFGQIPYNRSAFNFDEANVGAGLAGPGVINSPTTIDYNKVGTVYFNQAPSFLNGPIDGILDFIWGSYDASTNAPVVYPNGASIQNLNSQVAIQIASTPSTLPEATNGVAYNASFSATGGQPPYTWSLGAGTQLPQNLTLSTNGVISGMVTNNVPGVYVFTVQLQDSANRVEPVNYFITVH